MGPYPKRRINGMFKCGKSCIICPFIKEGKHIKSDKFTWSINSPLNCNTQNIVYMIQCTKERCKERYIGESERSLFNRISEHISYIRTNREATGKNFNEPGHSLSDMKVSIIEKVNSQYMIYRKERESLHIRKYDNFYKGIDRTPKRA